MAEKRIINLTEASAITGSDYLVIDSAAEGTRKVSGAVINDAIGDVAEDISSLDAQFQQFIAPTGEAPNPTEIENARVGDDGVTYTNLGTAIRTQFSDVKSDFSNSQYFGYNLVLDNFATQAEWNVYNSTAVFDSNVVTLTATVGSAEANIRYIDKITQFVSGHKYYASCRMKSSVRFRGQIWVGNKSAGRLPCESDVWNIVDGIAEPTSNSELGFYAQNYNGGASGDAYEMTNPFLIDLTEAFGAGNEPTVETMRKILNGDFLQAFSVRHYQDIMGARTAGAIIVASADSAYVGMADYVTIGKSDQIVINNIIANQDVSSVYLAPDSVFSISAPIVLKSNLKLFSDGAKIVMENQVSATITSTASIGATTLYRTSDECVNKFAIGMFIEITDGTNSESHYISNISYPNGKITIDSALTHKFLSGSTIKNVSSAISGDTITDTVVEGLEIDLNLTNNPQATNTFYAQNGVHLISSERCKIMNCKILNGGRHGVLFYEVNDSVIDNCIVDTWEEHCIDIYESGTGLSVDGTPRNNTVSNCVLTNATLAGVQNHGGSGNTIIGCVFHDNGECGVSCYGGANSNLISDCRFTGNDIGIKVQTNGKKISINDCHIYGNTRDGISAFSTVDQLLIANNQIHDNGRDGIGLSGSVTNTHIVGNNIYKNTQYQVFFENASNNLLENNIIEGKDNARCVYSYHTCQKNCIMGNVITKGNSTYAIKLEVNSDDTVIVGNVFKNFSTPISDAGAGSIVENNYNL